MKVMANSLGIGCFIKYKGDICKIISLERTKPGKGGAYVQLEVKFIQKNCFKRISLRSGENVEKLYVERSFFTYLHRNKNCYVFMNNSTYEQIELSDGIIGEKSSFLEEGIVVKIEFIAGDPIQLILPEFIELEVKETSSAIKGQSATGVAKHAIVGENFLKISVPGYIKAGDIVSVNTTDKTFSSRKS